MRAILTYHSIDDSGSPISLPLAAFRRHVEWLASGRVAVLPLGAVLRLDDDRDAVAITFDDGFDNLYRDAWPILRDCHLPFTVFVVTDRVGGDNEWGGRAERGIPTLPLMSWDALVELRGGGAEIGAHTRRHRALSGLPEADLEDEMVGSADRIAAELGARPSAFAYPYGDVDPAAASVAARVFSLSCTTEYRPLTRHESAALLPRLDMWYFRQADHLEMWGTPAFRRRVWLRGQARRMRRLVQRFGLAA